MPSQQHHFTQDTSMKTLVLMFALGCSSLALLDSTAEAAASKSTLKLTNPGSLKSLNPQPLPPRWQPVNPLLLKGLNPQPLPPRWNSKMLIR